MPSHKSKTMQIEIITKNDIASLDSKLNFLIEKLQACGFTLRVVYTTKELAEKLKVSTKTINNWREQRLIEYCKVQGTILFTEQAVSEFLAVHSIKRKSSLFTSKTVNNG